jgi:methyl-accepting chemotaxis protein
MSKPLPSAYMKKWSKEEDDLVIADTKAGVSYADIAVKHDRTANAIKLRVEKLVYDMSTTMNTGEISTNTGLGIAEINKIIKKLGDKKAAGSDTDNMKSSIANIEKQIGDMQLQINEILTEVKKLAGISEILTETLTKLETLIPESLQ